MGILAEWRAAHALRRRARAFVRALLDEPSDDDVRWLAAQGTGGDVDHARWELRYARRAMGLLTAQRDALDDRTGSAVARQIADVFDRDPAIAAAKRDVAQRQFNARLRSYGEALAERAVDVPTRARLGRALLTFAGHVGQPPADAVARGGDVLATYLAEANEALRAQFGVASLPENVPPSAVQGGAR
jgi:hypothetical protein